MGDESWAKNDWYASKIYYEKAFVLDSANFEATRKYADALRMTKDYQAAAHYYAKMFAKDRGRVFPKGQFWLATMQKYNGDYKEALRNFKKYNKRVKKDKKSYDYLKSKQEKLSCTWAINSRKDSSKVEVENLDSPVNTIESEFGAYYQDSILFFSTLKSVDSHLPISGKVKIYQSEFDSIANNVRASTYNTADRHQANVTYNANASKVYFSRCDSMNSCLIFGADVEDGLWLNIKEVPEVNQTNYTSTMPNMGIVDGQEVLFFVSNRIGGEGKMDIWWSKVKDGEFQKPRNAGDKVNTIDDEITPFYLDRKLYFSSNWHEGLGGFDIFVSEGITNDFEEPINVGYPINSSVNDMYYSYFRTINQGFLTSNRVGSLNDGEPTCCNDIWTINYTDSIVEGFDSLAYETLADLNSHLPVTLYFHNDEPDPRTLDTTTALTYLDSYNSYSGLIEKYKKENSRGMSGESKENAVFDVEDFFDFFVNKGVQDLEIFSELLLKELEEGAEIKLSVRGFASPLAESDYNVNLTKRRISSLINQLEEYQGGILEPYFENSSKSGGSLTIQEIPFGEFQADNQVSDRSDNKKESIYSRAARLERKIEIMSVERMPEDSVYFQLELSNEVYNFGIITSDSIVFHEFELTNTGSDTLIIDSVEASCGCTIPKIGKTILSPTEKTTLLVSFDPKGQSGLISKKVYIFTNQGEEPKEIIITAEIR